MSTRDAVTDKKTAQNPSSEPITIFADGHQLRGLAEHGEDGAFIFEPTTKGHLAIGADVSCSRLHDGKRRGEKGPSKGDDAFVVVQRFTVLGVDRYLLVPSTLCEKPRPRSSTRNRDRGFRVNTLDHPIDVSFQLVPGEPSCEGTIGNISAEGAALIIPQSVEKRSVDLLEVELQLSLFSDRRGVRIRAAIKNRRLSPGCVLWGVAFRFESSPEPQRAETMVRDYLIRHQLELMRKRAPDPSPSSAPAAPAPLPN